MNFPSKLFLIIEEEHGKGIIEWNSNGLAFRIINHKRLEQEILPKHFKHAHFTSVKRQLNLYGFKYVHRGENKGCFYNQLFRRGDFQTARCIARFSTHKKKKAIAEAKNAAASNGAKVTAVPVPVVANNVINVQQKDAQLKADADNFSLIDVDDEQMAEILEPVQTIDDVPSDALELNQSGFDCFNQEAVYPTEANGQPMHEVNLSAPRRENQPSSQTEVKSSSFCNSDIYTPHLRPSALTSRIGFNIGMLRPMPNSRMDGNKQAISKAPTFVERGSLSESFQDSGSVSARTFNPRDGLPGLTNNNLSIDDLLQFLARESKCTDGENKKLEITNAFSLW